jgi:hypothetical protein
MPALRLMLGPSPASITGRCRIDQVLMAAQVSPTKRMTCYADASRRVQLGDHLVTDVCLWCSLVATERLSARLVAVASP